MNGAIETNSIIHTCIRKQRHNGRHRSNRILKLSISLVLTSDFQLCVGAFPIGIKIYPLVLIVTIFIYSLVFIVTHSFHFSCQNQDSVTKSIQHYYASLFWKVYEIAGNHHSLNYFKTSAKNKQNIDAILKYKKENEW